MEIDKKKIVVNTFFLYAKTLITMIISFISTRLILEGLGASDFGIYGTVGGAIVMYESLNGAMAQATQRYMNYAEGKGEKEYLISIFNNTILLHIGLGLIIALLLATLYYPLFNVIFNIPANRMDAAKYIYIFLAVSTFFTIITVPYDAMITAHENFLYYSMVGIIVALLKLGAAFYVVYYLSDKLILFGLLMAVITIINMIIMRIYCHQKYEECRFEPMRYAEGKAIKEIGVFAGWNFIGAFSGMAGNHGSTILMNHFFGPVLIAAKTIGDQLSTQVAVLTYNMTKALNPVVVKSEGSGDRQTMLRLTFISCRFSFLLYLILAVPFVFNTKPLLTIWLKVVPEWAVLFCQLQVVRTLFEQFFVPLRMSLMAQGSVKEINLIDLALSIATFILLWFLYQIGFSAHWHYYISILLLVFASGIAKALLCRKLCAMRISDYWQLVIQPCIVVMMVTWVTVFLLQQLLIIHVLLIVCFEIAVLFAIEVILGLNKHERTLFISKVLSRF